MVAAFGQILTKSFLDSLLCVNVHASLLPAYRGAAPIERALAAGESRIGVTIMRVTEALDSGPWALQTSFSVGLRDDAGTVGRALAFLGALGLDRCSPVWTTERSCGPNRKGSRATRRSCVGTTVCLTPEALRDVCTTRSAPSAPGWERG